MKKPPTNFIKKPLDHKIIIKKQSGMKQLKKEYDKKVIEVCKVQK